MHTHKHTATSEPIRACMLGCRSRRKAEAPHCPRAPSTRLCRHNKRGGVRHWYRTATTRVRVEKKQNWGPVRSSASTAITPSCGRQHAAYVCHVSQGARPSRSPLQCAGTAGGASSHAVVSMWKAVVCCPVTSNWGMNPACCCLARGRSGRSFIAAESKWRHHW